MRTHFEPGQVWHDTQMRPIQAHGGGLLRVGETYYWYGEDKGAPNSVHPEYPDALRVDVIGIHCYSSRDLLNWKDEGLVLQSVKDCPNHDLHPSGVVERPKVVRNARTGQYVMWMHIDKNRYQFARAGVAVADSPTGPFCYLGSVRPEGMDSRDMTVFQDDDGSAYLVFGTGYHTAICITQLTDDYRRPSGRFSLHFKTAGPPLGREAPALFKHQGRYFMITSGTTSWDSNAAEYAVAEHMHGPWRVMGNPCVGHHANVTFNSQSTYVLPVEGRPGCFIFLADRWNPTSLCDSRYVWLPLVAEDDHVRIEWHNNWNLQLFEAISEDKDLPMRRVCYRPAV